MREDNLVSAMIILSLSRFGVGQNLYIYKQSTAGADNDWERAVADWYGEVRDFSSDNIEPFKFSSNTGHYTQVVWAESDRVGCGVTTYKDGPWFTSLYVCNYGPSGNYIQGQMYRQGTPCSDCEEGFQCSTKYPGLCGNHTLKYFIHYHYTFHSYWITIITS